jgi:hypothetical protein
MPYDQFARELLTSSGSNFRVPPVNFYRAVQSKEPKAIAQTVALTFMGARAENWPKDRLEGMAAFFSQIGYKETASGRRRSSFSTRKPALAAVFPGWQPRAPCGEKDPREVLPTG